MVLRLPSARRPRYRSPLCPWKRGRMLCRHVLLPDFGIMFTAAPVDEYSAVIDPVCTEVSCTIDMLMVQETSVQTGSMTAEYSSTGAAVNMIPKSGSNTWRQSIRPLFQGQSGER